MIKLEKTLEMLYFYALEKSENKPDHKIIKKVIPELTIPLEMYLKTGIEKGFLRDIDLTMATDFIHNSLFSYVFFTTVLNGKRTTEKDDEKVIKSYLDMYFNGIIRK